MLRRLLICLAALAMAGAANAEVIHTYSGNSYDIFVNTGTNLYATATSVTGTLTTPSGLADGIYVLGTGFSDPCCSTSFLPPVPAGFAYSFSDGVSIFTNTMGYRYNSFQITLLAGEITDWDIALITSEGAFGYSQLGTFSFYNSGIPGYDYGTTTGACGTAVCAVAIASTGPGVWDAAIPEPETYAMLLTGLGLLGFAQRRKKRKEAAAA